jgi:hypothetical protein
MGPENDQRGNVGAVQESNGKQIYRGVMTDERNKRGYYAAFTYVLSPADVIY